MRFKKLDLRASGSSMIQLSEFEFYNGDTKVPVPLEGVTNPGGSNAADAGEGAQKLVDDDTDTKWLDANGSPLVFDFGSTVTIDSYRFATANDANGRDPVSWRIEISETGGELDEDWTPVDQRIKYATPTERFTFTETFTIAGEVEPYIKGFEIVQSVVGGEIINYPPGTTFMVIPNGGTIGLLVDVENADTIEITPSVGQTVPDFGLVEFTPEESEQTTYTLTASNSSFGGSSVTKNVTIRSSGGGVSSHRYIRFIATHVRSGVSGAIQLDEFEFFKDGAEVVPVAVTNPGGSNAADAGEGAINLINGAEDTIDPETSAVNYRKWFDNNKAPVIFDFGDEHEGVDSYRFSTANDWDARDPIRWILEGSDDQESWTTIDSFTTHDYPTPLARHTFIPTIYLDPAAPPVLPTVEYFYAVRVPEVSPSAVEFRWKTANATFLEIDPVVGNITLEPEGSMLIEPEEGATYTLTAQSGAGEIVHSLTVPLSSGPVSGITYEEDFADAGTELVLHGVAEIVNDFPQITQPGDSFRLRLTPDRTSQSAAAWYGDRISLGGGFDTTFGMSLVTSSRGYGAEGMSFIVQNTPDGSNAFPGDNGPESDALSVKFSSWDNTEGVLNEARVNVFAGTTLLATSNLRDFPQISLRGQTYATLTGNYNSVPYAVRIVYAPGDLDVYVDGVQVLENVPVTLGQIGAVDAEGTAYVGFAARNGGLSQATDVTSWTLTGTPGSGASEPIKLLASSIDPEEGTATFTWSSTEGKTYRITSSTDLQNWSTVLSQGIPATGSSTSGNVEFTPAAKTFFRVEEEN